MQLSHDEATRSYFTFAVVCGRFSPQGPLQFQVSRVTPRHRLTHSKAFPFASTNRKESCGGAAKLQGDPTQVTGLPELLVLSYVDRFPNPFSHLTTTLGDLIEHIKHLGTCTITWETDPISFILMYRFSFNPLSFSNAKCKIKWILFNFEDYTHRWHSKLCTP